MCTNYTEKLIVAQLAQKLRPFMKPEGSSPCSQQPATEFYPEPDESSAYPQTLIFFWDPF
jgi:hypothetical protein